MPLDIDPPPNERVLVNVRYQASTNSVPFALKKTRTVAILFVAALMVVLGLFFLYFMLEPIVQGHGGKISGWPLAITIGGLILPFVARGRRSLKIFFTKGKYSWTPPVVVDKGSRQYITQLLDHIVGGFRAAGVQVTE
jgi:hypothetical protein